MSLIAYTSHVRPDVIVTGAAKEGRRGPPVDPVEVSIHAVAFRFKVDLPGLKTEIANLRCDISRAGEVKVHGVVLGGEVWKESSIIILNKRLRRISPSAAFTIGFTLPGPVEPRRASPRVHPQGILEVIVFRLNV